MVPNLSFTALRAFESLARNGSVTKTAAELGLSAPAISMQMKQLETRLSVALVSRSKRGNLRGSSLTPHGILFARMVQRWFAELEILITEFTPSLTLIAVQAEALVGRIDHLRKAHWWETRETAADILTAGHTMLEDISRAGIATEQLSSGGPREALMQLEAALRASIDEIRKAEYNRSERLSANEDRGTVHIVTLDDRPQDRRSTVRRAAEAGIARHDREFRSVADVELLVNTMKVDLD